MHSDLARDLQEGYCLNGATGWGRVTVQSLLVSSDRSVPGDLRLPRDKAVLADALLAEQARRGRVETASPDLELQGIQPDSDLPDAKLSDRQGWRNGTRVAVKPRAGEMKAGSLQGEPAS